MLTGNASRFLGLIRKLLPSSVLSAGHSGDGGVTDGRQYASIRRSVFGPQLDVFKPGRSLEVTAVIRACCVWREETT